MRKRRLNLSGLKPGSRQWSAHVHQYGGGKVSAGRSVVGIDVVCRRHPDEDLGRFRAHADEEADPRYWSEGPSTEGAGEYPKVVLQPCGRGCRTDVVWKPATVQTALDELRAAGVRRVVTYRV